MAQHVNEMPRFKQGHSQKVAYSQVNKIRQESNKKRQGDASIVNVRDNLKSLAHM